MDQQVTYDRIMQTAMGFWASKTLMSAVELGIFDALASGPLNATALGLRLGIHERSASDFFDALVAQGLLQRDNERIGNRGCNPGHCSQEPFQPNRVGIEIAKHIAAVGLVLRLSCAQRLRS